MDTDQLVNDPHMNSREMTVEVEQMLSGPLKMPGTVSSSCLKRPVTR